MSRGQNCNKDQFLTSDNFAWQRVRGNSDIKKKNKNYLKKTRKINLEKKLPIKGKG